jgi:hypothetical protein
MFVQQPYNHTMMPTAPQAFHEWARQIRPAVTGTFTLDADASTTVTNELCTAASVIVLMATNAAAATLMAGASSLYITPAVGSFAAATANAGNAAGTETFAYAVLNR